MVIVPWRAWPVLFTDTVNATLPLPAPLPSVGEVIVIHEALLIACHGHVLAFWPGSAVTPTESDPPFWLKFSLLELSEYVQGGEGQHLTGTLALVNPALVALTVALLLMLPLFHVTVVNPKGSI